MNFQGFVDDMRAQGIHVGIGTGGPITCATCNEDWPCAASGQAKPEQFILLHGDYVNCPVGPFPSEAAAHEHYQRNQPHSKKHPYLSKPKILRLLRPAVLADPEPPWRRFLTKSGGIALLCPAFIPGTQDAAKCERCGWSEDKHDDD